MTCVSSLISDSSLSASPTFFLGPELFREKEGGGCVHRYYVGFSPSSLTCHPLFSEREDAETYFQQQPSEGAVVWLRVAEC